MSNIPCEIIEDLLPSYIDELTSEVTNNEIRAHLSSCDKCKAIYEKMMSPDVEARANEKEEIDFLKKTKRNQKKVLLFSIIAVLMLCVMFIFTRNMFWGRNANAEYLSYNIDVSGKDIIVDVNSMSKEGIKKVDVTESDGIIKISVSLVPKSIFFKKSKKVCYSALEEISQIWIGDRIVWAEGEEISILASRLYAVHNPYIGNMPANGKVVNALNMVSYLGNFKNELQTKKEPYSWKMILESSFLDSKKDELEKQLEKYAFVLLAEIENVNEIEFEYDVNGKSYILSFTSEDASRFAGENIKAIGRDIIKLEYLIRKLNLSNINLT